MDDVHGHEAEQRRQEEGRVRDVHQGRGHVYEHVRQDWSYTQKEHVEYEIFPPAFNILLELGQLVAEYALDQVVAEHPRERVAQARPRGRAHAHQRETSVAAEDRT